MSKETEHPAKNGKRILAILLYLLLVLSLQGTNTFILIVGFGKIGIPAAVMVVVCVVLPFVVSRGQFWLLLMTSGYIVGVGVSFLLFPYISPDFLYAAGHNWNLVGFLSYFPGFGILVFYGTGRVVTACGGPRGASRRQP